MRIYDHLGDTHDLSEEVEGVAEPGVLPLPGGESLARLQVEVEVQVEVLEAAPVHEDVEHVVCLFACLQRRLHPVQLSGLEELGSVESAEKTTLSQGFGGGGGPVCCTGGQCSLYQLLQIGTSQTRLV